MVYKLHPCVVVCGVFVRIFISRRQSMLSLEMFSTSDLVAVSVREGFLCSRDGLTHFGLFGGGCNLVSSMVSREFVWISVL